MYQYQRIKHKYVFSFSFQKTPSGVKASLDLRSFPLMLAYALTVTWKKNWFSFIDWSHLRSQLAYLSSVEGLLRTRLVDDCQLQSHKQDHHHHHAPGQLLIHPPASGQLLIHPPASGQFQCFTASHSDSDGQYSWLQGNTQHWQCCYYGKTDNQP